MSSRRDTRGPVNVDDFLISTDELSPPFLGLTVSDRNRRVVERALERDHFQSPSGSAWTLTVPPGVVITPILFEALPPPSGSSLLVWDPSRPPLVWNDGHGLMTGGAGVRLPKGAVLDVSTRAAQRRATWQLLLTSAKPTDGWLSRHVHRPISRVVSYVLLHAGVSANQASLITLAIGIASGWFMAQTTHRTMIAGALLLWCASIADGIDGEIARTTLTESPRGEQIDTAIDHATHILAYVGVMIGWWRQGIGPAGAALMAAVALGLVTVFVRTMAIVRSASGSRQFFVDTKPIEKAMRDAAGRTSSPMLRAAASLWVLLRREALAMIFFIVSLTTGSRAVYPVILAAGLALVGATLAVYRDAIGCALRTALSTGARLVVEGSP